MKIENGLQFWEDMSREKKPYSNTIIYNFFTCQSQKGTLFRKVKPEFVGLSVLTNKKGSNVNTEPRTYLHQSD